jgi:hypothetical protein
MRITRYSPFERICRANGRSISLIRIAAQWTGHFRSRGQNGVSQRGMLGMELFCLSNRSARCQSSLTLRKFQPVKAE